MDSSIRTLLCKAQGSQFHLVCKDSLSAFHALLNGPSRRYRLRKLSAGEGERWGGHELFTAFAPFPPFARSLTRTRQAQWQKETLPDAHYAGKARVIHARSNDGVDGDEMTQAIINTYSGRGVD